MFIEVTATGSNGAVATGTMHLNFNAKQYCIERYTGWGRTAFSVVGTFAPAGRSIILTDQNTPRYGNKITIEGAPVG